MANPIPIDVIHQRVFAAFLKQYAHTQPQQAQKQQRTWSDFIDGTVSDGLGVWIAHYDFKERRWTHLSNREITDPRKQHPRIDLDLVHGVYQARPL